MPANFKPIFPVSPVIGIATLTSPTAITSRANIAGVTGLTSLTPTSVEGRRIDKIEVTSKGTSSAGSLFIWMYDGTTSYLMDEILIAAVTPSTTVAAFTTSVSYSWMVLPPTYRLYISVTVAQDLNVFAFGGNY
jgi:hypothetical protein